MEAFGYFRVTGLVHKNNLRHNCRKPLSLLGGFFEQDCLDLMDEQDGREDLDGYNGLIRYIMEAFGYFRVTRLVLKNNLRNNHRKLPGLFEQDCLDLMDEQDGWED